MVVRLSLFWLVVCQNPKIVIKKLRIMASTIRWLHLSDFHVGKDSYEQERLFEAIVKEVGRFQKDEKPFVPDYVFITGDIANKGLKKEYETFRNDFLLPLEATLGAETIIFPVPGNHDVERPGTDTLDRDAPLATASRFFDASKEGKTARDQILPRFKNYKRLMVANGMSPDWLAKNEGTAVLSREVAGVSVGVVGLNTAWLCKDDHDKDKLTPGYRLVEAALKKIGSCQIKIVLGHHPLSWWHDREEGDIRRLFAEYHVIYLHGHKHKAEGRFEEGGVDQFLVLQAGAAFQAREGDQWVNGFSWGELDPVTAEVNVSPWRWVNGEWRPDLDSITLKRRIDSTDWFRFPVPGVEAQGVLKIGQAEIPEGWLLLNASMLNEYRREVSTLEAQRFFDGAEPDWALALSPDFPVREQAKELLEKVADFNGTDRPQVALLRGPTAEGKSMALRQIVSAALKEKPELQVLWHQDETRGIDVQAFESLLTTDKRWLIASDHGDMIVGNLAKLATSLKRTGSGNVQFIIAAHDSDWKLAGGDKQAWFHFTHFDQARLSGLLPQDAISIASTWLNFRASASDKSLQSLMPEQLANCLLEAAKDDSNGEGALFGALLTLRHGRDLRAHVRLLLQKFDGIKLPYGGTVGTIFRLIAAMHAEGLDFLSSKVLQEVAGCDRVSLQREVLGPLTAEAAVSGGEYLRIRHRRIAKATLEVCGEDDEDLEQLYLPLVAGAIRVNRIKGEWLDVVSNWEYLLPKHFFDSNRRDFAIRIAEKILETVPNNSHYAVNLARLKRESGDLPGAMNVLKLAPPPEDNRGFWLEWGTTCGMTGDYLSNAVLHAFSISDDLSTRPPTIENSTLAVSGLAKTFDELYVQLGEPELLRARASCAWLGSLTDATHSILQGHLRATADIGKPKDVGEGISWLHAGLVVALRSLSLDDSVEDKVGNPAQYKFSGLQRVVERHLPRH